MQAHDLKKVILEEYWESRAASFPFRTSLSLRPLIEYWRELTKSSDAVVASQAKEVIIQVEKNPDLLLPMDGVSLIEKHRPLVDLMMSQVFPTAFRESDCTAAVLPFSFFPFYATKSFTDTFMSPSGQFIFESVQGNEIVDRDRTLSGYVSIAARNYGFVVRRPRPRLIYTTLDAKTGLRRYYDFFINTRFIDLITVGTAPKLTESKRAFLQKNLRSMEAWIKTLPTEHFEFSGFSFIRAIDVTMQEVTTSIKQILIDKDSITSEKSFRALEENVCTLLSKPGLELRLTIFFGRNAVRYSCMHDMKADSLMSDYLSDRRTSTLRRFVEQVSEESPIALLSKEDLSNHRMELDLGWLNSAVEHEIIAPLRYQGELIGFLELGSKAPLTSNEYQLSTLNEILPLVSVAVKRSFDELQSSVQNIIRERCTAIHPSIQWRFEKAAFQLVSANNSDAPMETIEFKSVYPLFSFTDICASTMQRNAAIRQDIMEELEFLVRVLKVAQGFEPMPMVNLFLFRVEHWLKQLSNELTEGDDLAIESALSTEIMPFVEDLRTLNPELSEAVSAIEKGRNGRLSVTSARETFEESLVKLTAALSSALDNEELAAQRLCPHYYEKRVTDGVEYSVYAGSQIHEFNMFSKTALRNLRLWQLQTAINLEKVSQKMRATLKQPLETAHCIVVQDTPLDILFKYDEKRFGVSGLANIRFEIIKKRVEKAMVNDKGERLTQPAHIAIVYSQDREKAEYLQFLDYLLHMGQLTGPIEELELRNTQELRGLRALRVKIKI